jgi:hypothetical protein
LARAYLLFYSLSPPQPAFTRSSGNRFRLHNLMLNWLEAPGRQTVKLTDNPSALGVQRFSAKNKAQIKGT